MPQRSLQRYHVVGWPLRRAITVDLGFLDNVEVPLGWWHRVTALEDDCYTACVFDPLKNQYEAHGLNMLPQHATFEDGSNGVEAGLMAMLDRIRVLTKSACSRRRLGRWSRLG
jgi:hypothetical protein